MDTKRKENYINEIITENIGTVFVDFSCRMDNTYREVRGSYKIKFYPEEADGKIIFFVQDRLMDVGIDSIAEQLKEYAVALKGVKEKTEKEYRRIFKEVVGIYYTGLELAEIKFLKEKSLNIAERIERFLKLENISQKEIYSLLKIDKSTLYRRFKNNNFTAKELLILIYEYNIPIDYFSPVIDFFDKQIVLKNNVAKYTFGDVIIYNKTTIP